MARQITTAELSTSQADEALRRAREDQARRDAQTAGGSGSGSGSGK